MVQLRSIVTILTIPIGIFLTVFQYYFVGAKTRKYQLSLRHCLKIYISRVGLLLGPQDAKLIHVILNKLLLKLLGWSSKLASSLPSYGERYDKNSFWVAKPKYTKRDDPVVVYLHGGGFFLETQPEQLKQLISVYHLLEEPVRKRTSVLLLDYKLVCRGHKFPTQLNQLKETYQQLVLDGFSNITLLGDSAGGNMIITFLQMMKRLQNEPWTKISPKNLVLISPWVRIDVGKEHFTPGRSFYDTSDYDIIQWDVFTRSSDTDIIGECDIESLEVSPHSKPLLKLDWKNVPSFNDPKCSVLLVVGEDEAFRDDVLEWARNALDVPFYDRVKYGNSHLTFKKEDFEYDNKNTEHPHMAEVTVFVEPWGIHDSLFFFEDHLFKKIEKNPEIRVEDLDADEFFNSTRVASFLSEKLVE